jgi:hypothetical protein
MIKRFAASIAATAVFGLASCGGGGGEGSSQQSIDPAGMYTNVITSGGPSFHSLDATPSGHLFFGEQTSMFVAR